MGVEGDGDGAAGHAAAGSDAGARGTRQPHPNIGSDASVLEASALWSTTHRDPVAGLNTSSQLMAFCDVDGKGTSKLLVTDLGAGATSNAFLKVWHGSDILARIELTQSPTGMVAYHMQEAPSVAVVAVASGPHVFVYKNMRPYYKFTLPSLPVDEQEAKAWETCKAAAGAEGSVSTLASALQAVRSSGVALSARSSELLALPLHERSKFAQEFQQAPATYTTVITAIGSLHKTVGEPGAVSCIVVCTESRQVLVLHPVNFSVLEKYQLPSVGAFMSISGQYDIEFRILVACRDGNIYTIKGRSTTLSCLTLPAVAVGLYRSNKMIYVGCMDHTLYCFSTKGKRLWSAPMPCPITAMTPMHYAPKAFKAVVVGLENGQVRIYNERTPISVFELQGPVDGLVFGKYGRVDGVLVAVTRLGELEFRMIRRGASLETMAMQRGPPPEQSIRINVPSKTQLYVDQTNRERQNAVQMHQIFHRDAFRLRLTTARSYAKAISTSLTPVATTTKLAIRLNAEVNGIGPTFRVRVVVQNTGKECASQLVITFTANPAMYTVGTGRIPLALLTPGVEHSYFTYVKCLTEEPISGPLNVFLVHAGAAVPAVTATVLLPVAEPLTTVR